MPHDGHLKAFVETSKGRAKKYPYYHCKTKGCVLYGKNLKKEDVEFDFEALLRGLCPSEAVLNLAEAIIKDCWKEKKAGLANNLIDLDRKKKELDHKIDGFMGRVLETDDREMIRHYEAHIKKLRMEREIAAAQAKEVFAVDTSYESAVGTVFDFIGNPYSLWDNGDLEEKRLVMNLAFSRRLPYTRNEGFGTAGKALPFSVLGDITAGKCKMVEEAGFEPT